MEKVAPRIKVSKSRDGKLKYFRDNYLNMVYMIPVLAGIVIFTFLPMGVSLVYSLCYFDMLDPTATLGNPSFMFYIRAFTEDWPTVSHAYMVTLRNAVIINGISFVGSYILALILNQKLKGIKVFRILYYLPCLIPGLASSLLWNGITKETGYFNLILINLGFEPFTFYRSNNTVFITQLLLSGWGFSGNMIMWLAQFKNIPKELYEEASLSGAGYFRKLFHVTIPMSTSMIFYLMIMSIIGSLQAFGNYATYLDNGRLSENMVIGLHIYEVAYTADTMYHFDISYACALSWILFVVIGIFTFFVFKFSNNWVYYAEEN